MTAGVQCDTCRTFASQPSSSWLFLVRPEAQPSIMTALMGASRSEDPATFCSFRCLADYAIARALVEGQAVPEEPSP